MTFKLLVTVIFCAVYQGDCGPKTVYKLTNVECVLNPKYCLKATCLIKAVNWNKATAKLDFFIHRPMRNLSVHVKLFKKDYTNQYHPFLIEVNFNLCDIIAKRKSILYGQIVWKTMKRFTNVNHSCPFEGHLYSRDMYVDGSYIPVFPLGIYSVNFNFTETIDNVSEYLGAIKLYAQAMEEYQAKKKKL